jgi:hypothetical protein
MSAPGSLDEPSTTTPPEAAAATETDQQRRADFDAFFDTHATWDAMVSRLHEGSDLIDPDLRTATIDAIAVLRRELDEGWPLRFYGSDSRLAEFLWNHVPWTCMMVVLFAQDLAATKHLTGWDDVRRRLLDPKSADPALLQMELGARALERDLQPSFEPPGQKARRADLRLQRGVTVMNVECTSIQALPEAADDAERVSEAIYPRFGISNLNLQIGGRVTGPFTDEELQQIAAKASEFYRRCSTNNQPGEFVVPNTVAIWAVPINHPQAQAFLDAHGGRVIFSVDFQHDPRHRLMATIERKATGGQLLPDAPGLLVVEPSRLLSQVHIAAIRSGVRQTILRHPHINAVALIHRHFGQGPDTLLDLSNGDFDANRTLYPAVQEEVVVLWNPARNYRDGDAIVDCLFRPPQSPERPR